MTTFYTVAAVNVLVGNTMEQSVVASLPNMVTTHVAGMLLRRFNGQERKSATGLNSKTTKVTSIEITMYCNSQSFYWINNKDKAKKKKIIT